MNDRQPELPEESPHESSACAPRQPQALRGQELRGQELRGQELRANSGTADADSSVPTAIGPAPPPVMLLGMHNSGTTVLAKILHNNGVFMGNSAGLCESNFFTHFINNRLLMGGGDLAWAQLPILSVDQVLAKYSMVQPWVHDQWRLDYYQWGYDGVSRWGFKDPRLCILLPIYLQLFPDADIVLIRRDVDDIAASLAHRQKPGVGVKSDPKFWRELASAHLERALEYGEQHSRFHILEYEDLCRSPLETVQALYQFLRIELPESAHEPIRKSVRIDRIGTANWSEARWRMLAWKNRLKSLVAPWYDLLRGSQRVK